MDSLAGKSDELLLQLYASGNNQAFNTLLLRYKHSLYAYIYTYLRSRDKSEDVFQETFIRVITKVRNGQYTENGKFKFYLLRIARNLIIDVLREEKGNHILSLESEDYNLLNDEHLSDASIEEQLIQFQNHKELSEMVKALPATQRKIVYLRFYENLSFKEIAEKTGCSVNTALGRMRYAMLNLRKMVQQAEAV